MQGLLKGGATSEDVIRTHSDETKAACYDDM